MYDPRIGDKQLTFGVSGKLYKSALVMYDRQTESLWSQILQQAITGPMTGTELRILPAYHTTWKDWSSQHPDTVVMSPETGYQRDYGINRYKQYWEAGRPTRYRTAPESDEHSPIPLMARVVGVQLGTKEKAYPFSMFENKSGVVEDVIAGKKIIVHFDKPSENAYVTDEHGQPIPSVVMFWFAWHDFYPDTDLARLRK